MIKGKDGKEKLLTTVGKETGSVGGKKGLTAGWGSSPLKTNGYRRGNSSFSLLPKTDDNMKLLCAPSLQSMVF